jgi:hypothetical protein
MSGKTIETILVGAGGAIGHTTWPDDTFDMVTERDVDDIIEYARTCHRGPKYVPLRPEEL